MSKREINRQEEMRPDIDERTASMLRAQERMREINVGNMMNPQDLLYFPPEKIPHGWMYKWIKIATMGEPETDHQRKQLRKGWSPVPADRHPEEARNHLMSSDPHDTGNCIVRGGLMLCEIPSMVQQEYEKVIFKQQMETMRTLKGAIEEIPHDPTVPRGILENSDDVTPNLGRTFGFS